MKWVITGAAGLLGWHARCRLHARAMQARYQGRDDGPEIAALDHAGFDDDARLDAALAGADIVLHFAGVNRASEGDIAELNPAIARRLVAGLERVGSAPKLVYANSTQSENDNVYGRSKAEAGAILNRWAADAGAGFVDLVIPHVFGEGGRPFYNMVTATLCQQVVDGAEPTINPEGRVELAHAGRVAKAAIDAGEGADAGRIRLEGRPIGIPELYERIVALHEQYSRQVTPDLTDTFDLALFNTYRSHLYPTGYPVAVKVNEDARGRLFEAAKGGGGGQTFLSSTKPGVTRGDHFHLRKVERFLVTEGEAVIRIRRLFDDHVEEFPVSGERPAYIDMPTLHTHNITNTGSGPLVTLFWSHEIFDPADPDTYADPV